MARVKLKRTEMSICSIINIKLSTSIFGLLWLFAADRYLHAVICMQLFAGELTNQNREYYEVNDNELLLF